MAGWALIRSIEWSEWLALCAGLREENCIDVFRSHIHIRPAVTPAGPQRVSVRYSQIRRTGLACSVGEAAPEPAKRPRVRKSASQ
jgi:hypothetical protein